jgi:hypothetical protein
MTENQMTIDEGITEAISARDEAIDRAERNADEEWKSMALECVLILAGIKQTFTTDDVWQLLSTRYPEAATHEPRALGAIMRQVARKNIIAPTKEYAQSSRKECHARPLRVWLSVLYDCGSCLHRDECEKHGCTDRL